MAVGLSQPLVQVEHGRKQQLDVGSVEALAARDESSRLAHVRGEQPAPLEQQLDELRGLLGREQGLLARRVPEHDRHRVLAQVAPHAREIVNLTARADAGQQQDVRRADRAGAQDQLAPHLRLALGVAYAGGALAVEVDPEHLDARLDRQVVSPACRLEPGVRGGAAQPLALVHARDARRRRASPGAGRTAPRRPTPPPTARTQWSSGWWHAARRPSTTPPRSRPGSASSCPSSSPRATRRSRPDGPECASARSSPRSRPASCRAARRCGARRAPAAASSRSPSRTSTS